MDTYIIYESFLQFSFLMDISFGLFFVKMPVLQFNEIYRIPIKCLRFNGAHPDIPLDWKWVRRVLPMHGIFTVAFIAFIYSLVFVDLKENNFTHSCTDGIFMVIWVVVTFKYCVLLFYRKHLKTLIKTTQEYFDLADSLSPEYQEIIITYAKKGRFVSRVWLYSCLLNCILFPIKSFVITMHSLYIGQFQLAPWYDSSFPEPIEKIKYDPPMFSCLFFMCTCFGFYAILMYIGFSPLGPIFIINACAQLKILSKEVSKVFTVTPYDPAQVSKKIATIVKNLQNVYTYVELINDMFGVLYELSLKASAMMIPITLYEVIDSLKRGELCLEYIAFIFTAALLCYVPCFYSDLLMERGEDLRLDIYRSGWECQHDKGARTSIMIMLIIALRPISIKTVFRTVNLDAFAGLCHQAYSLFSLINAAWNN